MVYHIQNDSMLISALVRSLSCTHPNTNSTRYFVAGHCGEQVREAFPHSDGCNPIGSDEPRRYRDCGNRLWQNCSLRPPHARLYPATASHDRGGMISHNLSRYVTRLKTSSMTNQNSPKFPRLFQYNLHYGIRTARIQNRYNMSSKLSYCRVNRVLNTPYSGTCTFTTAEQQLQELSNSYAANPDWCLTHLSPSL